MYKRTVKDRISGELRTWLALSAAGAGVAIVSGIVLHLTPSRIITAALLSAGMVFSGYFMRSFGRPSNSQSRAQDPSGGPK